MSTASAIDAAAERSQQVRAALDMARQAHAGQVRSASGGRPFIDHPVAVAELVSAHVDDDDALAAALLHDVVEGSDLEVEDVRRFGERVAELVGVLTDDESIEPYAERKREHRDRVEAAGGVAMTIYAADKLTNLRMLRDAYEVQGEQVGEELSVPLDEKVDVWERDLGMLRANPSNGPAVSVLASGLEDQLNALAADRRAATPPA